MKTLKRVFLISFISVLSIIHSHSEGKQGTTFIYGKQQNNPQYGVKINVDSDLLSIGDIIDFQIIGNRSGRLEIFRTGITENNNWILIAGWDHVNKVNRDFIFPYNPNPKSIHWYLYQEICNYHSKLSSIEFIIKKYGLSYVNHILVENTVHPTVLHIACVVGRLDIISFLINKGANIKAKDKNGLTPLHYVARFGKSPKSLKLMSLLIDKGASINEPCNDGFTPLHLAVEGNEIENVKLLLDKGALINEKAKVQKASKGVTPLDLAYDNNNKQMIDFLKQQGAKE